MSDFSRATALVAALAAPAAAVMALPAPAAEIAAGEVLAENQVLRFWILDSIATFDPAASTDKAGADVLRQLFEGLMNEDAQGGMVPAVAEDYQVSDDGLTYRFRLRDARWSNGDPVTAQDFVNGWRRAVDPAGGSANGWLFEVMNVAGAAAVAKGELPPDQLGVSAIDERTLEVRLTEPTPYFLKMLGHPATFPVNRKAMETFGDQWADPGNLIGNGAYRLDSVDPGVRISLSKSDAYWNADQTVLTGVEFVTENDRNAALARFHAGEIDWFNGLLAKDYRALAPRHPDQVSSAPVACTYAFIFNLSEKGPDALKDPRIRQALSLALDRDFIVGEALQGGQRPAYTWTHWAIDGFTLPDVPMAALTQDQRLIEAADLLVQAGYGPDNPLRLTLDYNSSDDHTLIARAARLSWKAVWVEVTLRNIEWQAHEARMRNQDFQIARYSWCADYNEASSFLNWFRSDGQNSGRWSNPNYDRLLDAAQQADDPGPFYTQAEAALDAAFPMVPVYHYSTPQIVAPDLRGVPSQNAMQSWYAKDLYRVAR